MIFLTTKVRKEEGSYEKYLRLNVTYLFLCLFGLDFFLDESIYFPLYQNLPASSPNR